MDGMNSTSKERASGSVSANGACCISRLLFPSLEIKQQKFRVVPAFEFALRAGHIDLALPGSPCPELAKEFEIVELEQIPFEAVLPGDHPLALQKRVVVIELKNDSFVGFNQSRFPGRNEMICRACQQAGFTPRFVHLVASLSALLAKVAAGDGVTLAPREVGRLPHPGAVLIPLKPPFPSLSSAALFRKSEVKPALVDFLVAPR